VYFAAYCFPHASASPLLVRPVYRSCSHRLLRGRVPFGAERYPRSNPNHFSTGCISAHYTGGSDKFKQLLHSARRYGPSSFSVFPQRGSDNGSLSRAFRAGILRGMKNALSSFCCLSAALNALVLWQGCGRNPSDMDDACPTVGAADGVATVSYVNDVVPLLIATKCLTTACHGGVVPSSRYDLRTYASSFMLGDDARRIGVCEIVPGDPERSFLIEKLRSADPRVGLQMPLEREPLTEAQIAVIEAWIREGAQDN